MRPVRLTLQAFGPYPERVVIDFRDAVQAGVFGIYGQTGSGKSSIFSAMTFALFGEPAKSEQDAASLRSDHADASIQTEVEFVFDISDKRYVVIRRPDQSRPKARGEGETRSPHEAYLFDATGLAPDKITEAHRGKVVAEKKVRDVDTAIYDLLGYGADQFRQIVLLPQGQFEKFLSANTRERIEILRELFDVSLYQTLMANLKEEAEAAERHVRNEREICRLRLSEVGFESSDALISGIEQAVVRLSELQEAEEGAQEKMQTAAAAMLQAEITAEKFRDADRAKEVLAELLMHRKSIEALAEQVRRTERAQYLLDVEERTNEAASDVRANDHERGEAEVAAQRAAKEAADAADVLKAEEARFAEAHGLRRKMDDLERYAAIIIAAADSGKAVDLAREEQIKASKDFEDARTLLTKLQATRTQKVDALKLARATEVRRVEITARRAALISLHTAAQAFERVQEEVSAAQDDVNLYAPVREAASLHLEMARQRYEEAERNLAATQALHLATKLEAGSPCPVCGAIDHPAPATGDVEHTGLDAIFRQARKTWEDADSAYRKSTERSAMLHATLAERESQRSKMEPPADSGEVLSAKIAGEGTALEALGPKVDIANADIEIDELSDRIRALETQCEALREHFEGCRQRATEANATHNGKLAEVPDALRNAETLAAERRSVSESLDALVAAKSAAEQAARISRENSLLAKQGLDSAEETLRKSQERHQKARAVLEARLAESGISEKELPGLKLARETIDLDKQKVEGYQRKLQSAQGASEAAAKAIESATAPDLQMLEDLYNAAKSQWDEAKNQRVVANHRLGELTKLRNNLDDTLRLLAEAEAASGALRELAAVANGQNPQKLNLETFAIGAMFDSVLTAANLRLGPMTSGRYQLERDLEGAGRSSRGLGIQVFDIHTGKARPTTTLSGGETFIAALALALGLADVVESASGKVRLDTIFIDEGFGSLDTENGSGTLEKVLQVLNTLVSQNRAVGLISHVPLVQEAIPNGFYVRKGIAGSSIEERGIL